MKQIYLIGGPMGVGKTTICQIMKSKLESSVYLDGDWCWNMNPFIVNEETKKMVFDNITHVLNNYLECSAFENVIFSWVMHEQSIINEILAKLNINGHKVHNISLICGSMILVKRLEKDINAGLRKFDVIEGSLQRLKMYQCLDTIKVDTTNRSPNEIVKYLIEKC